MPLTAYTFLIGVLAISGVHFLSGYFSKDAILLGAYNLDFVIFSILYLGAILTSIYMFRLYFLTFCGEARSKASAAAHESTIFMTAPLLVLAFLSVVGGFIAIYPNQMVEFLKPDIARVADMPNHLWMNILGLIAWVGGLFTAWKIYGKLTSSDDPLAEKSPNLFNLSRSKLFFDEIYSFYVQRIQDPFFRFLEVMELLLFPA